MKEKGNCREVDGGAEEVRYRRGESTAGYKKRGKHKEKEEEEDRQRVQTDRETKRKRGTE